MRNAIDQQHEDEARGDAKHGHPSIPDLRLRGKATAPGIELLPPDGDQLNLLLRLLWCIHLIVGAVNGLRRPGHH